MFIWSLLTIFLKHRASFPFSQAVHVLANEHEKFVPLWINQSFTHQSKFYDFKIAGKTQTELHSMMADLAGTIGAPTAEFLAGMSNRTYEIQAKVEWKVGCSRGVYETPSYFLNGVLLSNPDRSWRLADWRAIIDPLL